MGYQSHRKTNHVAVQIVIFPNPECKFQKSIPRNQKKWTIFCKTASAKRTWKRSEICSPKSEARCNGFRNWKNLILFSTSVSRPAFFCPSGRGRTLGTSFKSGDSQLSQVEIWFKNGNSFNASTNVLGEGGSPGLVSMGWELQNEGCGFESLHCILDGHFSHWFVAKIVLMFAWERPKINEKEASEFFWAMLKNFFSCSNIEKAEQRCYARAWNLSLWRNR